MGVLETIGDRRTSFRNEEPNETDEALKLGPDFGEFRVSENVLDEIRRLSLNRTVVKVLQLPTSSRLQLN